MTKMWVKESLMNESAVLIHPNKLFIQLFIITIIRDTEDGAQSLYTELYPQSLFILRQGLIWSLS